MWVVGRDTDDSLQNNAPLYLTYPDSSEKAIIYFQGRPTPSLSTRAGGRFFGTVRCFERFPDVDLVAVEVDVSAWLWHRRVPPEE